MLRAIEKNDQRKEDNNKKLTILSVEDDRVEQAFLKTQILDLGHKIIQAADGDQALKVIESLGRQIDIILMDKIMPNVDGLTVVREIKKIRSLRSVPVIMVTSATTPHDIQEGLDAGVFYYLNKPANPEVLKSVLSAAVREVKKRRTLSEELKKHKESFTKIEYAKFNFSKRHEAESLAAFIALCFPRADRALTGLAELLINAIEHGNLEIGYEEKTRLINNGRWQKEILKRQEMPEYKDRKVIAIIKKKPEGVYVVITDEGQGFDWKTYITIDPARAGHSHGRGIARAKKSCFDRLTYNETGNQVIAFMATRDSLKW